jgi:hypothetical protein
LNIDFRINNERQDCKIGIMCVGGVLVKEGRVSKVDEDEGIWLMGFTYIYEIEQ